MRASITPLRIVMVMIAAARMEEEEEEWEESSVRISRKTDAIHARIGVTLPDESAAENVTKTLVRSFVLPPAAFSLAFHVPISGRAIRSTLENETELEIGPSGEDEDKGKQTDCQREAFFLSAVAVWDIFSSGTHSVCRRTEKRAEDNSNREKTAEPLSIPENIAARKKA